MDILLKYGAPKKLSNAIQRLYSNFQVALEIRKESRGIQKTVGVRQGHNLSPVIFLFVMTAFTEIDMSQLLCADRCQLEAWH